MIEGGLRLILEQCEPGLVFWLVEELLDSQTIDGCRNVFDYLDSRRERITAVSIDTFQTDVKLLTEAMLSHRNISRRKNSSYFGPAMSFCGDFRGQKILYFAAGSSSFCFRAFLLATEAP